MSFPPNWDGMAVLTVLTTPTLLHYSVYFSAPNNGNSSYLLHLYFVVCLAKFQSTDRPFQCCHGDGVVCVG